MTPTPAVATTTSEAVQQIVFFVIGLIISGLVATWMTSIYRAADRAAKSAQEAALAMAALSRELGTLIERTAAHAARLDELGRDLKAVRDYTYERARDQQSVATLVARHVRVLEALEKAERKEGGSDG